MASRTTFRREGMIAVFGATIDACAEKIGGGFHRLTEPLLQPGEQSPDITLMIQLLGRMIAVRFQSLLNDDRASYDERANDKAPRSLRDQLADKLYAKLVKLRLVIQLAFGEDLARTVVPITGKTASVPVQVYRQGEHTLARLLDAEAEQLESLVPGVNPDLTQWAEDLQPLVTNLGSALGVIDAEKTKASETVEQKSQTLKDLDFHYSHAYAILRGFLFLVGLPKAAKELPTLNRTRRSQRGPDLPGALPAGDEPAGEEPAGEEPSGDEPSGDEPGTSIPIPQADPEGAVAQDLM